MYTIQTDGRKLSDVMVKGNIIRIDTEDLSKVSELQGWIYKELPGHGNIHYVELVDVKLEPKKGNKPKQNKKRFIIATSTVLGVEAYYEDYETGKTYPYWYVFDKLTGKIVDCVDEDAGEGAREKLKRQADKLNEEWLTGTLNENELFDE